MSSPNADASSADSVGSAKRLECVRFIGAFRPARDGQRFRVPMHDRKTEGALHEPECSAGFPACATSQSRFMVPMHAEKRKEALPEGEGRAFAAPTRCDSATARRERLRPRRQGEGGILGWTRELWHIPATPQ